ncbi:MAG TPA: tRNA (adenosine(37)-N6)-threonylcarbamoyltransferase complex transferase subunit TsaD [Patescibacteria group bacterium]|nr:tRNA (adenosine(37)-N6)-threonylcarbamoyltransferase complex transferase subunit TsaD [Patescibacteria group bacterium]
MIVLGIETSCDETSAALVKNGRDVLSNVVSSSLAFHSKYGGVVPEIASRMQLEAIVKVTDTALRQAGIKRQNIGLVCVTHAPGLLGSLVVGLSFAKALSVSLRVPVLGVNHLCSHIYANFLDARPIRLPFVALIISGGHTSLFFVRDFNAIRSIGATLDDACGEAFDKVAKILGLGYPGGPPIERLALRGDPHKFRFKCSETRRPLDFSFSGIKTAVLYQAKGANVRAPEKADIAASFQEAVVETVARKAMAACRRYKVPRLVVGGGVAANSRLRQVFRQQAPAAGVEVYFPPKPLCMDNAAMVAGLGYRLYMKGARSDLSLGVELN